MCADGQAQQIIDGEAVPELAPTDGHSVAGVEEDVRGLWALADQMRKRRFQNGSLRLDTVKLVFKRDERGVPIETWTYGTPNALEFSALRFRNVR